MKTVDIYSLGALPPFTVSTESAGYWTERISCELSANLRAAQVAGMVITQAEDTDLDGFYDSIVSLLGSSTEAITGVFSADGTGETADTMPEMPDILTLISENLPLLIEGGIHGGVFGLFAAFGLSLVLHWIKSKAEQPGKQFDPSQQSDNALKELAEKIFDELQALNDREECIKLSDESIIMWKSKVLRGL